MKRILKFATVLPLLLLLSACDDFNITNILLSNGGLELSAASDTVLQGSKITLYPHGGTKPYTWPIVLTDIQDVAAVTNNSYLDDVDDFHADFEVGLYTFYVIDQKNYKAAIDVIVRPIAPTLNQPTANPNKSVNLSWTYSGDTSYISGFVVIRSERPTISDPWGPWEEIGDQPSGTSPMNTIDTTTNNGPTYRYIVKAFARGDKTNTRYLSYSSNEWEITP